MCRHKEAGDKLIIPSSAAHCLVVVQYMHVGEESCAGDRAGCQLFFIYQPPTYHLEARPFPELEAHSVV